MHVLPNPPLVFRRRFREPQMSAMLTAFCTEIAPELQFAGVYPVMVPQKGAIKAALTQGHEIHQEIPEQMKQELRDEGYQIS